MLFGRALLELSYRDGGMKRCGDHQRELVLVNPDRRDESKIEVIGLNKPCVELSSRAQSIVKHS
jgi:hypothetical protein